MTNCHQGVGTGSGLYLFHVIIFFKVVLVFFLKLMALLLYCLLPFSSFWEGREAGGEHQAVAGPALTLKVCLEDDLMAPTGLNHKHKIGVIRSLRELREFTRNLSEELHLNQRSL